MSKSKSVMVLLHKLSDRPTADGFFHNRIFSYPMDLKTLKNGTLRQTRQTKCNFALRTVDSM